MGEKKQSGIHLFEPQTQIMFTTMLQRNAVECWSSNKVFSNEFSDTVEQNDETLYYPVDMIVSLMII